MGKERAVAWKKGTPMTDDSRIQIYRTKDGEIRVDVRFGRETVWLTQAQMVALFQRDVSIISRHIKNSSTGGEINKKKQFAEKANCPFRQAGYPLWPGCGDFSGIPGEISTGGSIPSVGHPAASKRSGAFLFVDFLNRNGRLIKDNGAPVINDTGLALEDEEKADFNLSLLGSP